MCRNGLGPCAGRQVAPADERARHQLQAHGGRAFVEPVAQLALKVGVVLLQRQALPVGHARPLAHQFNGGQIDERTHGAARALCVVAPHIELHAIGADAPRQVHALATRAHDDFVGRVQPGDQGARAKVAQVHFHANDGGVAALAVAQVHTRARHAGVKAVAGHVLVHERDGARDVQRGPLQLDLVVVEQDGGEVLNRVLAGNVHLVVHVAEGIAQARHLRQRGDDHVLAAHGHAARVVGDLLAGDERGGHLRRAQHVVHAHQRIRKAGERTRGAHAGPVGDGSLLHERLVAARIHGGAAAAQQCAQGQHPCGDVQARPGHVVAREAMGGACPLGQRSQP